MSNQKKNEDGYGTTGHEWDGIEEWNNPLPRWWLWTFYLTIIWGVGYTIAYPAWPLISQATGGLLGYSTRAELAEDLEAARLANAGIDERLATVDLAAVSDDAELLQYANSMGASVFRTYCSQCHGSGAAGVQAAGYPNLLDDAWLWGGTVDEIQYTVRHGIRNEDDADARWSEMPAFGDILTEEEIAQTVNYVMSLSGNATDPALVEAGETVYLDNCAACHGDEGLGDIYQGAPNLADAIWLYGGDVETLTETVTYSRFGVMPPWSERLSEAEIRGVALYVHGLGGGE
ncbi:MAG: cytochrome-c oxidase, cbb3-type subunit III [Pseudomonadota bacterium]